MRCKICSKTFRSPPPRMRESQICTECQGTYVPDNNANTDSKNNDNFYKTVDMGNVAADDIDISKGQAEFLKSLMKRISNGKLNPEILKYKLAQYTHLRIFVNDNWGSENHFIKLAFNHIESNQISQILNFLKIKNKIEKVPTKQDMKELSMIDVSEYEKKFKTWENFLDLLGFDPWYKNNDSDSTKKLKKIRRTEANNNRIDDYKEQEKLSLFLKNDTLEETIKKINELRITIKENFKKKDSEENYTDYSYVKMFDLLEKYIEIMPNKSKYDNIKDLS
jgi:hypothetical protein